MKRWALLREPDPIWLREMRQSGRLLRTPWVIFGLTLALTLLMSFVGGVAASTEVSTATVGSILFQTFFSVCFFVVLLIGPAIAASSVASEREGRTWEALLLTGLRPNQIARGKFLAAFSLLALYIVAMAPVGALPFLFGGVTAVEVVVAYAFLFLFAALAIAFGLAVSSLVPNLRMAIVLTLLLAVGLGPSLFSLFGFGLSLAAHEVWKEVPEGLPVWLPLAYARATFGWEYVTYLLGYPLVVLGLPAWFLYEVTVSNLTGEADDHSSGIKRWFLVATPLLALSSVMPMAFATTTTTKTAVVLVALAFLFAYLGFMALLFAREPFGPSRRVLVRYAREHSGGLKRALGPGLAKTSALFLCVGLASIAAVTGTGVGVLAGTGLVTRSSPEALQLLALALYGSLFFVFLVGLSTFVRARGTSPWASRLITVGVVALISIVPWVAAAVGGAMSSGDESWFLVAAPSPFFVVYVLGKLSSTPSDFTPLLLACGCAFAWGAVGLLLFGVGVHRVGRIVERHRQALEDADRALEAEEQARQSGALAPT